MLYGRRYDRFHMCMLYSGTYIRFHTCMLYGGAYLRYGGKHLDFIGQYVKFHRRMSYCERYVRLLAKKVLNLLTFFISFVSIYIIRKTNKLQKY